MIFIYLIGIIIYCSFFSISISTLICIYGHTGFILSIILIFLFFVGIKKLFPIYNKFSREISDLKLEKELGKSFSLFFQKFGWGVFYLITIIMNFFFYKNVSVLKNYNNIDIIEIFFIFNFIFLLLSLRLTLIFFFNKLLWGN